MTELAAAPRKFRRKTIFWIVTVAVSGILFLTAALFPKDWRPTWPFKWTKVRADRDLNQTSSKKIPAENRRAVHAGLSREDRDDRSTGLPKKSTGTSFSQELTAHI